MKAKVTFKGSDDPQLYVVKWGEGEDGFDFVKDIPTEIDTSKLKDAKKQLAHRIIMKGQNMPQFDVEIIEGDDVDRKGLPADYVPVRAATDTDDDE